MSRLNASLPLLLIITVISSLLGIESPGQNANQHADRQRLEVITRRLTAPELDGRAFKTEGGHKAAEFIAALYREIGLKPAAGRSDYFQPIAEGGQNVAGLVEGERKDAFILVGAHFDAFGGAFIGARDSAAAVAVMLEIARLTAKAKPQRSILFVAFDGEEQRQAGAKFYIEHPLVPIEKTETAINLHNFGSGMGEKQPETLYVSGAEFSRQLREAAGKFRETEAHLAFFGADAMRWQGNEHGQFTLNGQPVLSITNGVHYTFHSRNDTVRKIDFVAMEKHSTTIARLSLELANQKQKIERQTDTIFDAEEAMEWHRLLTALREQVLKTPKNDAGQSKIDDVLVELKRFQNRPVQDPLAREAVVLRASNICFFIANPAGVDYNSLFNRARNHEQDGEREQARIAYQKLLKFIEEEYRRDDRTVAELRARMDKISTK